jgi:hypothetical protein
MSRLHVERIIWAAAIASLVVAWLGWRYGTPSLVPLPVPSLAAPAVPGDGAADSLAGERALDLDPFRIARHPSPVEYLSDADGMPPPAPPAPKPPKPLLAISGIVGGPPWAALIEGVPGREGTIVVRQGDTLGGLTVRRVGRDTVTVLGMDTTWKLAVRRTWRP